MATHLRSLSVGLVEVALALDVPRVLDFANPTALEYRLRRHELRRGGYAEMSGSRSGDDRND